MASKDIEIIQGDTFTMGFRVVGKQGPVDFTAPDVRLFGSVTDASGRRIVGKFEIIPVDLEQGQFRIFLDSQVTAALRGKHIWAVRYERGINVTTIAGGNFTVKVGA